MGEEFSCDWNCCSIDLLSFRLKQSETLYFLVCFHATRRLVRTRPHYFRMPWGYFTLAAFVTVLNLKVENRFALLKIRCIWTFGHKKTENWHNIAFCTDSTISWDSDIDQKSRPIRSVAGPGDQSRCFVQSQSYPVIIGIPSNIPWFFGVGCILMWRFTQVVWSKPWFGQNLTKARHGFFWPHE